MKKIIRLTESDLARIVRRVIAEEENAMNATSGKISGRRYVIKDPKCGMDIMTVRMGKVACASQTRDGLGCNTLLQVTEVSDYKDYFEKGPQNGCDKNLYRFLTGDREGRQNSLPSGKPGEKIPNLQSNQFELYFDCAQQQLYLRGKQMGMGVFQKSHRIDSDELEMVCMDACDSSDN